MENTIEDYIANHDLWKELLKKYLILQSMTEYHCTFTNDTMHAKCDTHIIRYCINNLYQAKLVIFDDISNAYPRISYNDNYDQKYRILMPCNITITELSVKDVTDDFELLATSVYKNHVIDRKDYYDFSGMCLCKMQCIYIKDFDTKEIDKLLSSFNKSMDTIINRIK